MFVTSTPWKLHAPIERSCNRNRYPRRRQWLANVNEKDDSARLRVAIVGGGWAGLGAAHALSSAETNRRAFQVTLIESREAIGGLAAGWEQREKRPVEVGVHGFWRPYTNLFDLVYRQLDLPGGDPFTTFTRSAQYSPAGLEAESPLFGDLPRLPSPLGTFFYPRFYRLPLRDRLSALALFDAVVDFDNSVEAWQKYDRMTARELFIRYGCTERLIRGALEPMLLVGLFAPSELCSASGALGMLYYFILAHQGDFDVKWVRGTTAERIFEPWVRTMTHRGGLDLRLGTRVIDVCFHPTEGGIDALVLQGPDGSRSQLDVDAVIFGVGISGAQALVRNASALATKSSQFRNFMHLGSVDVLAVRLYFDRRFRVPRKSNAFFGFDAGIGGTFFDLNVLHDETFGDAPGQVIEMDFYGASSLLVWDDDSIVNHCVRILQCCLRPNILEIRVLDSTVVRAPRAVTHFRPGSYQHFPNKCATDASLRRNVYFAGDWIDTRHGSFSQEKAYVTGLEAANALVQDTGRGSLFPVLPIEPDEPQVTIARRLRRLGRVL
ncbi:hypothetical protein CCYA_CCYA03G0849 [Cyanidiococcus yangmingshanensis]|nr:hypothetical protein CCYA_CCYA03G0849 [Cyanidiococcus yangmingshanensis]